MLALSNTRALYMPLVSRLMNGNGPCAFAQASLGTGSKGSSINKPRDRMHDKGFRFAGSRGAWNIVSLADRVARKISRLLIAIAMIHGELRASE